MLLLICSEDLKNISLVVVSYFFFLVWMLICSNAGFEVLHKCHCGTARFLFPAMKGGWGVSCCTHFISAGTNQVYTREVHLLWMCVFIMEGVYMLWFLLCGLNFLIYKMYFDVTMTLWMSLILASCFAYTGHAVA
jgi:hypothetical protein